MKTQLYLMGLMLAIPAAFVPATLADGAGLSGQCYDADASEGGEDELRFDTNSGLEAGLSPVPGSRGITDALVLFGTQSVLDGGQTGTACKRYDCYASASVCAENNQDARFDYLEADVEAAGLYLQACYKGSASIAGDCPQHPTGPGA